MENKIVSN